MKKYVMIINLIFSSSISAQNIPISINADFGLNYLFSTEVLSFFNSYTETNRKIGYNFSFSSHYLLNKNNNLWVGIEYINSEITATGYNSSSEWIFHAYPISLGYQYIFDNPVQKLFPYLSINISYYISKLRRIKMDNMEKVEYYSSENGFGLDGSIGGFYELIKKIKLSLEMKLRYANGSYFSEDSKYASIEFTGIYLNLGVAYNF